MSDRFPHDRQAPLVVLGALVVGLGVFGLIAARSLGFTEAPGVAVIDVTDDFMWGRQLAFNPLGALAMLGVGLGTLATAATRRQSLAIATAAAATLIALATLSQLGAEDQILASRAGNVALLVAVALAVSTLALTPAAPGRGDS